MNDALPQKRKTLGQIEAMRAVAVTGIFLYHLVQTGAANPFGPVLWGILSQGWMGVILFNIVTGFVLTLPFAGPTGRPMPGYFAFLRRRFLRICPNYSIGLFFWTAILVLTGLFTLLGEKSGSGLDPHLAGIFLQHLFFVHTFNPSAFFSIVPAYWWMGLLAQFYLAYPLLWRLFRKFGPKRAALLLIGGCLVLWAGLEALAKPFPHSIFSACDYMFYYNLPYRLAEFVLGMYLACAWQDYAASPARLGASLRAVLGPLRPLRLIALLCLIGLAAWGILLGIPDRTHLTTHLYWLASILCAGLLLFLWAPLDRLGKWGPVARLGSLSYSIYLMHQPILGYATPFAQRMMAPFPAFIVLTAVCGFLSIVAAMAMDRAVAWINRTIN